MNLEKILGTIAMLGSDLPAYKALLDEVIGLFSEDDQTVLKQTYAQAKQASDAAHAAAQAL